MERLTSLAIVIAFSLVLDRGFNDSQATVKFAHELSDAKTWVTRSSAEVARTIYGFGAA